MDEKPSSYVPNEANSNIRVKLLDDLSKPFTGNDVYEMSSKNRGHCLIFGNWSFNNPELNRHGPQIDSNSLQQIFQQLSFDVKLYPNFTKCQIELTLQKISKSNLILRQHNAFVAIFLSHGQENGILASDSKIVSINKITENFSNEKCKGLIGKPKIFFISACRGDKYDNGVLVDEETSDEENSGKDGIKVIPTVEDMFISYSTISGMISMGTSKQGTWFVTSLVTAIANHAKDTDLESILKIVQGMVREKEPVSEDKPVIKQSIEYKATGWRKKLYFNPGYPQ